MPSPRSTNPGTNPGTSQLKVLNRASQELLETLLGNILGRGGHQGTGTGGTLEIEIAEDTLAKRVSIENHSKGTILKSMKRGGEKILRAGGQGMCPATDIETHPRTGRETGGQETGV